MDTRVHGSGVSCVFHPSGVDVVFFVSMTKVFYEETSKGPSVFFVFSENGVRDQGVREDVL